MRAQYGKLGREILERAFSRRGKPFSEEALAVGLGSSVAKDPGRRHRRRRPRRASSADVIKAAWPEETRSETPKRRRKVKRAEEGWFGLGKVMGLKFRWPGSSSGERERTAGATASRSGACVAICR